jgi:hypothetical protein
MASDHIDSGAELLLPESIAQDGVVIVPLLSLFRPKSSAQHGLAAKYIEEVRCRKANAHLPRIPGTRQLYLGGSQRGKGFERRGFFAKQSDVSAGDPRSGNTDPVQLRPEEGQLAGVFIRDVYAAAAINPFDRAVAKPD